MLAHGVEVDQRPLAVVPEQVVALEVAMADALADQLLHHLDQRIDLLFRRLAVFHIGRKARGQVRAIDVFGDQIRTAAQAHDALLQHCQGFGRGDVEELQAVAFDPRVPGPARAPEALEPVRGVLDVVALEYQ
ncbi:hypothetical protein D3C79_814660 [compost metagenome]